MSTSPSLTPQAIERLLSTDISVARRLIELLQEENDALISRDRANLDTLITEKQQLMEKLDFNSNQRSRWIKPMVDSSGKPQEECWQQLVESLDDGSLTPLWQEFQDLINDCKQHNERNGKLISRGQNTLRQLLAIFRGQYVDAPKLYTASGATQSNSQSHTVTKA